jgi:DNA (cytosine-5)-methyltransferase 1
MIHFSLFSGIGGFDLASEWMGWKNYLSCEIADFPNQILEHYWPDAYHHRDVKTLNYETINNELSARFGKQWRDDDIILTGGFPCQPYSSAGKRLGKEDERHLWPEMLRIISEIKPKFIVGENVFGLLNWNGGMVFAEVCSDLEHQGYEITPVVIPAAAKNAPHGRDRIWFVAYANGTGEKHNGGTNIAEERKIRGDEESNVLGELCGDGIATDTDGSTKGSSRKSRGVKIDRRQNNDESFKWRKPTKFDIGRYELLRDATNTNSIGQESRHNKNTPNLSKAHGFKQFGKPTNWTKFPTQPPICSGNDGLPDKLDGITFSKWRAESIKGYGNAIVPQVAFEIFKAIEKTYFDFQK